MKIRLILVSSPEDASRDKSTINELFAESDYRQTKLLSDEVKFEFHEFNFEGNGEEWEKFLRDIAENNLKIFSLHELEEDGKGVFASFCLGKRENISNFNPEASVLRQYTVITSSFSYIVYERENLLWKATLRICFPDRTNPKYAKWVDEVRKMGYKFGSDETIFENATHIIKS